MMKSVFTHPLLIAVLVSVGLYVFFAHVLNPPIPASLLIRYMLFAIIGILMVGTFNDKTAKRMAEPIRQVMGNPRFTVLKYLSLVTVMGIVSLVAYNQVKPDLSSPVELRTVHPAPPSSLRVYGKSYNLLTLENPLRKKADKGSEEFATLVKDGGDLYYKNCIYCHGDLLDGQGQFGPGFDPRPANFQDVGTIAQLQESYLFWRITTGGPGLPREGAPWRSAMPVWHEMLNEDEVWKIILFLYDYTGQVPRSWELEESSGEPADAGKAQAAADPKAELSEEAILDVYGRRCAHCHGEEGDGLGPAAEFLYPLPRDFTLGVFKYKSTHADDEFPTDDDMRTSIMEGLTGTSMPAWKTILSDAEVDGLIKLIKKFGYWDEEELTPRPIDQGTKVASSPESISRGKEQYIKTCEQCHGAEGRGDVTSGKRLEDDWQNRVWPRNLTRPNSWRATKTVEDVFNRLSVGIRGTPMPEHTTVLKTDARWDIANYVMTLRDKATPLAEGDTVVRGARINGDLPISPDDPAWDQAPPITFALVPNVIRDPRLYFSLNDRVTVRALFNATDVVVRMDVDDRTYSVPGDPLEERYRVKGTDPTRDAVAVQFPAIVPEGSQKPWFRHGDPKNDVNMWYWSAPSVSPEAPPQVMVLDAKGPDAPPRPREGDGGVDASGAWKDGQWRVMFKRSLTTDVDADTQFQAGRYIPIAFGNWDGVSGQAGSRHTFTSWYWLLLEPEAEPFKVFGVSAGSGLVAGFLFVLFARRQRRFLA